MVKSKVIFEDEEQVEIKYPCFELKDIVEYYFEICTPNNSITPFSLVALPNANILVSIYISDSSQTFKVHREHGIIDTSGDKISGSLTEAITVIHAPGTHEFSIKFKPGVLYSCLSEDIPTLVDNSLPLQKYLNQKPVYVNSVNMGRKGVMIVESEESYSEISVSIRAAFNAGIVNGELSLDSKTKEMLKRAQIYIYIIGGNGEDAAKVVTGFPAFQDFIIKGGVYSKEIYGVPISFSGANAADNSMFISQIKI